VEGTSEPGIRECNRPRSMGREVEGGVQGLQKGIYSEETWSFVDVVSTRVLFDAVLVYKAVRINSVHTLENKLWSVHELA
jgi:hypothetical protein